MGNREGHACPRIAAIVFIVVVLLTGFTGARGAAAAPPIYDDDALWNKALEAYNLQDWNAAARYLEAYIQRDPQAMRKDLDHEQAVVAALEYCLERIEADRKEAEQDKSDLAACPQQLDDCAYQRDWYKEQSEIAIAKLNESDSRGLGAAPPEPPARETRPPPPAAGIWAAPPGLHAPKQPTSYPMVCRGAEGLPFTFQTWPAVSSRPIVMIDFAIAGSSLTNNLQNLEALGAGECKWIERPGAEFDTGALVFPDPILPPDSFAIRWSGGAVQWVSGADWLKRLSEDKEAIEAFHAYNDGKGHLIVTKRGLAVVIGWFTRERQYSIGHEGLSGLRKGGRVYTDRDYEFDPVPDFLSNATYVQTANADRLSTGSGLLVLWANRATHVYVAHDVRYTVLPAWLKDFKELDESLSFWDGRETVKLRLYEKYFAPGGIVLGGNVSEGETKKYGMYSVVLTPAD
jgi:hypothetical protein